MKIKRRDMWWIIPGSSVYLVMAGLVPAIHVLDAAKRDVDARDEPGHDDRESGPYSAARLAALANFFSTRSRLSFYR
jgi:hypothetical protein